MGYFILIEVVKNKLKLEKTERMFYNIDKKINLKVFRRMEEGKWQEMTLRNRK